MRAIYKVCVNFQSNTEDNIEYTMVRNNDKSRFPFNDKSNRDCW